MHKSDTGRCGLVISLSGLITVLSVFGACGGRVWAADSGDVEAILRKGTELRRQGRDADALAEFQRAFRIQDSPRASAQVALAEQALGLWLDANGHLTRALEHASDPWIQKNRTALDGALTTIQAHLCQVEVWGLPAGAEVTIDGKVVGNLPSISTWLDPGTANLHVRSAGFADLVKTLKMPEGGKVREHVDLRSPVIVTQTDAKPSGAAATNLAARAPAEARDKTPTPMAIVAQPTTSETQNEVAEGSGAPLYARWWFWAIVGAGAAVAGGTTLLLTHQTSSASSCTPPACSNWMVGP